MIDDVYGMEGPSKGSKTGEILKGIGSGLAGAAGPIAGALYGLFGPSRDTLRREQQEDQQKFTNMQVDANKNLADYTSELQFKMANKTAAPWQVEKLKEAGLNPALMYEGAGGAGGTTGSASAGSAGSGQAASSAATRANELAYGMQIAQTNLMAAQAEKTKAETKNIEAGTEKTGVDTATGKLELDTKTKTQEATIQTIQENAAKALADAVQSQQKQVITEETMKDQIKSIQAEALGKILNNKNLTTENKIKEAESTIKQFEATMAESGISPKTPWYMKLLIDQLEKFHLNPLK